jgi:hypothetical protein
VVGWGRQGSASGADGQSSTPFRGAHIINKLSPHICADKLSLSPTSTTLPAPSVTNCKGARTYASTTVCVTGSEALGGAVMMLFFAAIGASAGSFSALGSTGWLLAFIAIQQSVHLAVLWMVARLALRLPVPAVLIAGNAIVGGPATAAAMANAKGWHKLIQPAVLTGTLGYAVATTIGMGMGHLMKSWAVA